MIRPRILSPNSKIAGDLPSLVSASEGTLYTLNEISRASNK